MKSALVPGSLAAIAERDGLSLAESFLNCQILVLIDQSGSMSDTDAPGGRSRYDAAEDELARLQQQHPGQVGVVEFSYSIRFCPGGRPSREGLGTDMTGVLNFARVADGVCQIVLISDGLPNTPEAALQAARRYHHPIHTIYIGPENDFEGGRQFLWQLAHSTGGRALQSDSPGLLTDNVEQLLLAS